MALGLFMAMGANAQTDNAATTPNRMIVNTTAYTKKAFAIDGVSDITFATKEGQVKANVEFIEYKKDDNNNDIVTVAVTRSDPNSSFSVVVLPTNTAKRYTAATLAQYFEQKGSAKYYQDFTHGDLSGFDTPLRGNTDYTVLTLAYDEYEVPCEMSTCNFTTPPVKTVGTPSVTYTVDEVTPFSVTLTVTPNEDCQEFFWCQFAKDGAQQQFEQWGPMMGFANIEDMVKQFSGYGYAEATTNTWKDLAPATDYEVMVLPTDIDGNYGEMVPIYFTTKELGGDGLALVDIQIGEFGSTDGAYWQKVINTPNEQTKMFRDAIVVKDKYDVPNTGDEDGGMGGDEGVIAYLQTEYPFEIPGWNQYATDEAQWNVDPATSYVAVALAKNAKDEWGTLVKKEFTTPASPANIAPAKVKAAKATSAVMNRINVKKANRTAVAPVRSNGLQLIER